MRFGVKKLESPVHVIIEKYFKVMKRHRSILERQLNKTGVYRSQHQLLMFIAENPNASQKEIAQMHQVSTATIAVSLKKLEKGGYISRIVDQNDNRYNQICITKKGKLMVDQSVDFFKKVEETMFIGFSHEEIQTLEKFFDRIYSNMETLLPETEREDLP